MYRFRVNQLFLGITFAINIFAGNIFADDMFCGYKLYLRVIVFVGINICGRNASRSEIPSGELVVCEILASPMGLLTK